MPKADKSLTGLEVQDLTNKVALLKALNDVRREAHTSAQAAILEAVQAVIIDIHRDLGLSKPAHTNNQ